jgi:hypothetical protein
MAVVIANPSTRDRGLGGKRSSGNVRGSSWCEIFLVFTRVSCSVLPNIRFCGIRCGEVAEVAFFAAKHSRISALAERTNTNAQTIRYYEGIGLLPKPHRIEGVSGATPTRMSVV